MQLTKLPILWQQGSAEPSADINQELQNEKKLGCQWLWPWHFLVLGWLVSETFYIATFHINAKVLVQKEEKTSAEWMLCG